MFSSVLIFLDKQDKRIECVVTGRTGPVSRLTQAEEAGECTASIACTTLTLQGVVTTVYCVAPTPQLVKILDCLKIGSDFAFHHTL